MCYRTGVIGPQAVPFSGALVASTKMPPGAPGDAFDSYANMPISRASGLLPAFSVPTSCFQPRYAKFLPRYGSPLTQSSGRCYICNIVLFLQQHQVKMQRPREEVSPCSTVVLFELR